MAQLTKLQGRVLLLTGDSNAWSRTNPILLKGEVGIEVLDNENHLNIKVGDGNTRFSELPSIYNSLPIASNSKLGIVKVGQGININAEGKISVTDFLPTTGGTITGNLVVSGDITGARVFNPVFNDYAEYFKKSPSCPEVVDAGEVVVLDDQYDYESYTISSHVKGNYFRKYVVVGVVSDSYGHIVGGDGTPDDTKNYLPVALAGRVNVKVDKDLSIRRGDTLMYSSNLNKVIVKDYFSKQVNCTKLGIVVDISKRDSTGKVKILIK